MINSSLVNGYGSIAIANYELSCLIRFILRFTIIRAKNFINKFYLILYAYVQTFCMIFLNVNFMDLKMNVCFFYSPSIIAVLRV